MESKEDAEKASRKAAKAEAKVENASRDAEAVGAVLPDRKGEDDEVK
ncbi:MAG: hypothetical protein JRD49_06975 [Deltaproteobacteria bacterium]|nr:hypothetical protein [Deltaproteobacteria bacterium]MBW2635633.1 hypothetical protein [Deltaproteobacteria bacterium]MBW2677298.1 hypothetical protein [Deltaproteobacteria bacterium]